MMLMNGLHVFMEPQRRIARCIRVVLRVENLCKSNRAIIKTLTIILQKSGFEEIQ
jgi:hypothetical protein